MSSINYYTVAGTRHPDRSIKEFFNKLSARLESHGFVLRALPLEGTNQAFIEGLVDRTHCEIYTPWTDFNKGLVKKSDPKIDPADLSTYEEASKLLSKHIEKWDKLTIGLQKMHVCSAYQLLGQDLKTPVRFVIAYTRPDRPSEGTNALLTLAREQGIEVYDLGVNTEEVRKEFYSMLTELIRNEVLGEEDEDRVKEDGTQNEEGTSD